MLAYILPVAVLMLMVSIGASLKRGDILANWKRLTPRVWLELMLATFIFPPALALVLAQMLALSRPETAGLILVAVAPGAPLMIRNIASRGFDIQLAASYQIWSALLVPVMIPLTVAAVGKLYHRDIWIPPALLIGQIVRQQFAPLLAGMLLAQFAPAPIAQALQRFLNVAGNILLVGAFIAIAVAEGPHLPEVTLSPLAPLAALLLAVGCMAAIRIFLPQDRPVPHTMALCNANRHVGLAILLAGQHLRNRNVVPILLCYALAALITMPAYVVFVRWWRRRTGQA